MKRIHPGVGTLRLAALLVAGVATMALPAALGAQGPALGDGTRVASAMVFSGGVDFMPRVQYREAVVTVSGNGRVFRQVLKGGGSLSVGVFDPEGQLLPDGVYSWELELVPGAKAAERLRAAAAQNGGIAPNAWQRESGTFTIHNGLVIAPDLVEPEPVRQAGPGASGAPSSLGAPSAFGAQSAARAAPQDDDFAVGPRKGVEAAMRAASVQSPAPAGAAAKPALAGAALERSDAAALAMGQSLERAPAPDDLSGKAQPVRRSIFDNSENGFNGRPTSDDNR